MLSKSEKQRSANEPCFTVTINGVSKTIPIIGYLLQQNYGHSNTAEWKRFQDRMDEKVRELNSKMEQVSSNNKAIEERMFKKFKSLERRMKTIEKDTSKIYQLQQIDIKNITNLASNLDIVKTTTNNLQVRIAEEYVGCFQDGTDRLLEHKITLFGNKITLALCKRHCKGYKFTGLQAGQYCLCGNNINSGKAYHQLLPESSCSMKCFGEPTKNCGHHGVNSIYRV